jgi:endonuclease/exonuclease/phosphatase (EEP) superfamily protein YafD
VERGVTLGAALVLFVLLALPVIARATDSSLGFRPPVAALAPLAAVVEVVITAVAVLVLGWPGLIVAIPALVLVCWQLPPPRRMRQARQAPAACAASESAEAGEPAAAPEAAEAGGAAEAVEPAAAHGPGSDVTTVRVLNVNALHGKADVASLIDQVSQLQLGVLAVQELTPTLSQSLEKAGIAEALPFSYLDPQDGSSGIGLWSRWPLTPLAPVPATVTAMPRAQLGLRSPVTITVVHPKAPLRLGRHAWRYDLNQLRETLADTPGHQIVAGDFNATRDHRVFRKILAPRFADCLDVAKRRSWPGFTWPANRKYPPILRLDHILVSRTGLGVPEARTVEVTGTDHRGVLAVIELQATTSGYRPASGGTPAEASVVP